MSAQDKDLLLKLRMMRLLWRLGYFVRKNVKLTRETEPSGHEITDIDVVGIKYNGDLNTHLVVCDCKSGRSDSNTERVLWLSGIMEYFYSDTAYFVREEMLAKDYVEMMRRLGINCITSSHLSKLEQVYGIDTEKYFGSFCKEQETTESILKEIRKTEKNLANYVFVDYWKDLPQQQILNLMNFCKVLKNSKTSTKVKNFLQSYALSMLSASVLAFASQILMLPEGQNDVVVKEMLLSGDTPYSQRKELLGSFFDFMVTEIDRRYKQKYPISKTDFLSGMTPEYQKHLVDFVIRICANPESAVVIPRFFDLLTFEFIQNGRELSLDQLFQGLAINRFTLKPLKDLFVFVARSEIIDTEFQSILQTNIERFEMSLQKNLDYFLGFKMGNAKTKGLTDPIDRP